VEENVVREGEKAFVRTLREHDKTFVSKRYSNKYGRYIEGWNVAGAEVGNG
jgi:hypothetical protein